MGCSQGAGKPSMPRTVLRRSPSPLTGCRKSPSSCLEVQKDPFSLGCSQGAGKPSMPRTVLRGSPSLLAGCRKSPSSSLEVQKDPFSLRLDVIGACTGARLRAGCRRSPMPHEGSTEDPQYSTHKDFMVFELTLWVSLLDEQPVPPQSGSGNHSLLTLPHSSPGD